MYVQGGIVCMCVGRCSRVYVYVCMCLRVRVCEYVGV